MRARQACRIARQLRRVNGPRTYPLDPRDLRDSFPRKRGRRRDPPEFRRKAPAPAPQRLRAKLQKKGERK